MRLTSLRLLAVIFVFQFSLLNALAASPRVLPQKQAAHLCRLLVNDGEGHIYPLSIYARRLTMLLCHDDHYGDYSAEQVFSGLIFFYDDWQQEPMPYSNGQGRLLMEELHSGQTLRLFPHSQNHMAIWYAPTDRLPAALGSEHQKYIREAFTRLNALVHASNWKATDAFIDRMIRYQCQFGSR